MYPKTCHPPVTSPDSGDIHTPPPGGLCPSPTPSQSPDPPAALRAPSSVAPPGAPSQPLPPPATRRAVPGHPPTPPAPRGAEGGLCEGDFYFGGGVSLCWQILTPERGWGGMGGVGSLSLAGAFALLPPCVVVCVCPPRLSPLCSPGPPRPRQQRSAVQWRHLTAAEGRCAAVGDPGSSPAAATVERGSKIEK